MATRDELEAELEWRRCHDVHYFLENYWYIKIRGGNTLMKLREPQQVALTSWVARKSSISLKARQIGWTTLATGYAFHSAFFGADREIVSLSKTERDAKKLVTMTNYSYVRLPQWIKDRGPSVKFTKLEAKFSNDSAIISLPSLEDPARGYTSWLVICDEWASFKNPENAWAAIKPSTEGGGQVIGFSTAKGYGNWFHKFYQAAEAGTNEFEAMFFPWDAVPDRDEEWYASQLRDMEPWQVAQEFPATAEEAFVSSGDPVFPKDRLEGVFLIQPAVKLGQLRPMNREGAPLTGRDVIFVGHEKSYLSLWEEPLPGMTYVLGADVAGGSVQGDYSTAHVICANNGKVVAVYRNHVDPHEYADHLNMLGLWYNNAKMAVERNGFGTPVLNVLAHRERYPNLYFHRRENYGRSVTRNPGWQNTQSTKAELVSQLQASINHRRILVPCKDTYTEMLAYARSISPSGVEKFEGKPHDDLVISLGIANLMLDEVKVKQFRDEEPEPDPGVLTHDWYDQMMEKATRFKPAPNTIGWNAA